MKTYRFFERSTRKGFTEWAVALDDGKEVRRIDRDIHNETVSDFRSRVAKLLEAEGYQPEANQYSL